MLNSGGHETDEQATPGQDLPRVHMQPSVPAEDVTPVPPAASGRAQPADTEVEHLVLLDASVRELAETAADGTPTQHAAPAASGVEELSGDSGPRSNLDSAPASAATAAETVAAVGAGVAAAKVSVESTRGSGEVHANESSESTPTTRDDPSEAASLQVSLQQSTEAAGAQSSVSNAAPTMEDSADQTASKQLLFSDIPLTDSSSEAEVPTYGTWTDTLQRSAAFDQLETLFSSRIAIIDGAMGTSIQEYKCDPQNQPIDQLSPWQAIRFFARRSKNLSRRACRTYSPAPNV